MTIEEILDCSADQLEKMSDEDLIKYLSPYFAVTRPELIQKPTKNFQPVFVDFEMKQKLAKLRELGIDAGFIMNKKR